MVILVYFPSKPHIVNLRHARHCVMEAISRMLMEEKGGLVWILMYVFLFLFFVIADFLHQDGVSLERKWSCTSLYSLRIQPEWSRSQNNSYFFLRTKHCVFEQRQSLEARLSLYAISSRMWGVCSSRIGFMNNSRGSSTNHTNMLITSLYSILEIFCSMTSWHLSTKMGCMVCGVNLTVKCKGQCQLPPTIKLAM